MRTTARLQRQKSQNEIKAPTAQFLSPLSSPLPAEAKQDTAANPLAFRAPWAF